MNYIIHHFWGLRKEFFKYAIIGVVAFIFDISTLYILKEQLNLSATLAVIINQPFLSMGVFFLNKHWSFGVGGLTHRQIVRYYTVAGFNYIFSVVWIYLVHEQFGAHYLTARIVNIILAVTWNFLLYKHWVYRVDNNRRISEK